MAELSVYLAAVRERMEKATPGIGRCVVCKGDILNATNSQDAIHVIQGECIVALLDFMQAFYTDLARLLALVEVGQEVIDAATQWSSYTPDNTILAYEQDLEYKSKLSDTITRYHAAVQEAADA